MHKRKHRKSAVYNSKDTPNSFTQASEDDTSPEFDPSLYIVAYEADVVGGAPAVSAALSLELPETLPKGVDKTNAGSALIQLESQSSVVVDADIGSGYPPRWVDRYDVRLLLDTLPARADASSTAAPRPLSPSGWSDLPSDAEDTFFFSPEEIDDYRRDKRRRLIDRGREERMRAILERDGKNDTADESDTWGASDEEPDEVQKELLCRTASHVVSSLNPAQLEMRILANHGADRRFAFLRGRWSRAWNAAKDAARQQYREKEEALKSETHLPAGGPSLQGLVGYGDSDDESAVEDTADERTVSPAPQIRGPESSDGEEARKQARRERAREWSARRRAEQCSSEGKG